MRVAGRVRAHMPLHAIIAFPYLIITSQITVKISRYETTLPAVLRTNTLISISGYLLGLKELFKFSPKLQLSVPTVSVHNYEMPTAPAMNQIIN